MGRVSPSSQNQSGKGNKPRKPPVPRVSPMAPGSRYSSGNAGGPGQFDFGSIKIGGSSSSNSNNRRGSGVRGRGADFSALKAKPSTGRRSRYSSGVKGASAAAEGAATGSQLSATQPSIEELRTRQDEAIKAYDTGGSSGSGGNGRGDVRTSPTGVEQKGTNTGFKPMTIGQANLLLSDGYKFDEGYDSNQLPTTATNLYDADPETVQFETGGIDGINTGASQQTLTRDLYNEGGAVTFTEPNKDFPTSDYIEQVQTQGNADLVKSGVEKPTDWLNRSALDNSDKNLARRRAFLDAESSLQGLRDAEATQNIVYAGGQHNLLNPNRGKEGENDFIPITGVDAGSDIRGYKSGRLSEQELLSKYVTAVKDKGDTAELPANIPNLPVQSEQPAAMKPLEYSEPADFTVPENTEGTVSKLIKLKSNLFK